MFKVYEAYQWTPSLPSLNRGSPCLLYYCQIRFWTVDSASELVDKQVAPHFLIAPIQEDEFYCCGVSFTPLLQSRIIFHYREVFKEIKAPWYNMLDNQFTSELLYNFQSVCPSLGDWNIVSKYVVYISQKMREKNVFVDLLKLSGLLSTSSRHKRSMSQTSFEMIKMHFITKFEFTETSNSYERVRLYVPEIATWFKSPWIEGHLWTPGLCDVRKGTRIDSSRWLTVWAMGLMYIAW